MIKKIRLQNLLSFSDMELELRNLNVLIGPNGSGKSNLIEALSLLQALPADIGEPIRRGGGIDEWMRKGTQTGGQCSIEASLGEYDPIGAARIDPRKALEHALRYSLHLQGADGRYSIASEWLKEEPLLYPSTFLFDVKDGRGTVLQQSDKQLVLASARQSVLSEVRGTEEFPEITRLGQQFAAIRLYREWGSGGRASARAFQPADQPVDFLEEDATNLALVLQNTFINSSGDKTLNEEFSRFFERFQRFGVSIFGNQVLLYMHEQGPGDPISATRWSDGMIRYLCLLAILCHPKPPGLICIDEPDLGLHPDIMPHLARLIKSASERTQIIITTHSAELVDEFTDESESVVVCERDFDGATQMERQDPGQLKEWLEKYTLGDLWRRGEIGGNPF